MSANVINWVYPLESVLHNAAVANGDGTIVELGGSYGTAVVQVTGITGTATLTFQGSLDGTNYANITLNNSTVATTTANGIFSMPVTGLNYMKVPISSYSSGGTITARANIVPLVE